MKERTRKILGIVLLLIGISGLSFSTYISYIGKQTTSDLINSFEDNLQLDTEILEENNIEFAENVIAILSIPSINIEYPIREGTDKETLKYSLGHFEETAFAGEKGNFAVAGHRNSALDRYFNRLDEVEVGDEVIVKTKETTYNYIVTDTFKVHETEVDILEPTDYSSITLVTCTNGYKPKYRIVVKGMLA